MFTVTGLLHNEQLTLLHFKRLKDAIAYVYVNDPLEILGIQRPNKTWLTREEIRRKVQKHHALVVQRKRCGTSNPGDVGSNPTEGAKQ